jgi:hypothetical protein
MSILDLPVISRIRRNHGLEHASLTTLSLSNPTLALAGISFHAGFCVLGKVDTGEFRDAVFQALHRMQNGEKHLAVHPNCGTNYVTTGIVAGLLAWLGMSGAKNRREKLGRLPMVISLVTLAFIFTRPLGLIIQERITTSGDPANLQIVDIFPVRFGNFCLHLVVTSD